MPNPITREIDRQHSLTRSREPKIIESLCRISLSAEAPSHLDIPWCEGLGKKTILYVLEPGKSITWPLNRAIAYFGPFTLFDEYAKTNDEQKKIEIGEIIHTEMWRLLNRFDYPRAKDGAVTGPHRAPDVTIEVLDSNNRAASKGYEIHKLYGIGKYDDVQFEKPPTEAEVRSKYEAILAEKDEQLRSMSEMLARLESKFDGAVAGATATAVALGAKPKAGAATHASA